MFPLKFCAINNKHTLARSDQTHAGTQYWRNNWPERIFCRKQSIGKIQRCHRWAPSLILGWCRKLLWINVLYLHPIRCTQELNIRDNRLRTSTVTVHIVQTVLILSKSRLSGLHASSYITTSRVWFTGTLLTQFYLCWTFSRFGVACTLFMRSSACILFFAIELGNLPNVC